MAHLNLSLNDIGSAGTEILAGVLGHCAALAHLNFQDNDIGTVGRGSLRASTLLRGVVKPLALFCKHLALLALCQLFSRQATRKSDIICTHTAW